MNALARARPIRAGPLVRLAIERDRQMVQRAHVLARKGLLFPNIWV
jgi:hypothetical protein